MHIHRAIYQQGVDVIWFIRSFLIAFELALLIAGVLFVVRSQRLNQAVASQQRAERRFEALFDGAYNALSLLTVQGQIVRMNRRALGYAELSAEEAEGLPFVELPLWDSVDVPEVAEAV